MRQSKIQLVELKLGKILIAPNTKYKEPSSAEEAEGIDMALQSAKTICKSPEYWATPVDVDEKIRDHTYTVKLGIRTPPAGSGYPYNFEVQYSGVIVNFDPQDGNPDKFAAKYGLALLYGAVRDQIFTLTAKMKGGALLVPTMSFEDEEYEDLFAAHQRLTQASSKKKLEATEDASDN